MNVTVNNDLCNVYKGSISNIDGIRCVLANIAATLYAFEFGYICIGLISVIIFISIFGGIKHNYRWFILNQAIWDLFLNHRFSCDNPIISLVKPGASPPTCIYKAFSLLIVGPKDAIYVNDFFTNFFNNAPYTSLFLLSASRFIAIFYMNLYDKFSRGQRIIWTIIIFSFISILIEFNVFLSSSKSYRAIDLKKKCMARNFTEIFCNDQRDHDFIYSVMQIFSSAITILKYSKPILCLLLSIFAAIMLIWRIIKQAKFQKKHNPKDFKNSIRITIVIFFQTLISFFILFLETLTVLSIEYLNRILEKNPNLFLLGNFNEEDLLPPYLPTWIRGHYGLMDKTFIIFFIQLRIFIESILILFIMTGYREAIIEFVKKIYSHIRKLSCKDFPKAVAPNFLRSKNSPNETTIF